MLKIAIAALGTFCAIMLTGCQEPTITSPWSGKEVTAPQLETERAQQDAAIKAESLQAEAELNSALIRVKSEGDIALAEIKAKFEPRLAGVMDKLALVKVAFDNGVKEFDAISAKRAALWEAGKGGVQILGAAIPGSTIVTGALAGGLALLSGYMARKAGQHKSNFTNLVDAMDVAETVDRALPAGTSRDDASKVWDATLKEYLVDGSPAALAKTAISTRKV